jgi:hypothetical protein
MAAAKKRIFTLKEAQTLLPQVQDITERAASRIESLKEELESIPAGERRSNLEDLTQELVQTWARDIERLGCEAKGLWLVDFDSGDGIYYCWQRPEEKLEYFHDYGAGFAGRKPLGPMLVN